MKQKKKKVPKGTNKEQETVCNIFKLVPQPKEQEQLSPEVRMGVHILNDPNHKIKEKDPWKQFHNKKLIILLNYVFNI